MENPFIDCLDNATDLRAGSEKRKWSELTDQWGAENVAGLDRERFIMPAITFLGSRSEGMNKLILRMSSAAGEAEPLMQARYVQSMREAMTVAIQKVQARRIHAACRDGRHR